MTDREQKLIDDMLRAAQSIRIIQVQSVNQLGRSWQEVARRADEAWARLNLAHRTLTEESNGK